MFQRLKNATAGIRNNLLRLESQPIGKAALTVVILLDLFIIVSIFDGLAQHTRQLTAPNEFITPLCRDIVITRRWNETVDLDEVAVIVNAYHERRSRVPAIPPQHATCQEFFDLIVSVRDDDSLQKRFKQMAVMTQEIVDVRRRLEQVRGSYDSSLLAKIAEEEGTPSLDATRQQHAELTLRLDALVAERRDLIADLEQNVLVADLVTALANIPEGQREALAQAYRDLSFWYPVKRLGMELLFLLPLIAIFYFWNVTSIKHQRPLQILVSSHLLVVAFVPVIFKVLELVYDILPRRLLDEVFAFLESIGLVAVWHYVLMAVGVGFAMFAVYLFQKKLFSREKEMTRRITKGLCQNCGSRIGEGSNACPVCGFGQFEACGACNEPTFVYGPFCRACGTKRNVTYVD